MHHEDFKNVTGLFKALNKYLTEQEEQSHEEDIHLKQEEADVEHEQHLLDTHPCPCIWGVWADWGQCSKMCGGGSKTRSREVAKQATNNGDICDGSSFEQTSCNLEPCGKGFNGILNGRNCVSNMTSNQLFFCSHWLWMGNVGRMVRLLQSLWGWCSHQKEGALHICPVWWSKLHRRTTGHSTLQCYGRFEENYCSTRANYQRPYRSTLPK